MIQHHACFFSIPFCGNALLCKAFQILNITKYSLKNYYYPYSILVALKNKTKQQQRKKNHLKNI